MMSSKSTAEPIARRLEAPQAYSAMTPEKITLPASKTIQRPNGNWQRANTQTIEERIFQFALITIECHFTQKPPIGRKTAQNARDTIRRTMEKTLTRSEVRYVDRNDSSGAGSLVSIFFSCFQI
jgi:hypothetical protein